MYKEGTWTDHQWDFGDSEFVERGQEDVKNMRPGILYRPVDPKFPAVDFLFVTESQSQKEEEVIPD